MATDPSQTKDNRYPTDGYGAEYPYNQVKVQYPHGSESQDDGTPGKERRRWCHMPSGTNKEIKPDGTTVEKHTANHNVYIKGGLTHTIDGVSSKGGGGSSDKSQHTSNSPNGPGRSIGGNDDYLNAGGTCEKKGGPHSKNLGKKGGQFKSVGGDKSEIVGGHSTSTCGGDRTSTTVGGTNDFGGGDRTVKTDGAATYTHKGGLTQNHGSSRNPGVAHTINNHGHHNENHKGNHSENTSGKKTTNAGGGHDTNTSSRNVNAQQSISHSAGSSASYQGGSSASLSSGGQTSVSGQSVSIGGGGGGGGGMTANSSGTKMGQGNTSLAANSTQVTLGGNTATTGSLAYQGYDLQSSLANNFSYTVANAISTVVLNISGSFGKGVITMPPSPLDGLRIRFTSANTITTLTINANANQTIFGAPTTMTSSSPFGFQWINSLSTWFRI